MRPRRGVEIESVSSGSPAEAAGLRPGDLLRTVNGNPLEDAIDLMFHTAAPQLDFEVLRKEARIHASVHAEDEGGLGITLKPFSVKTCRNNCVFCFVKQLPKGLRRSLYVKDEDYRLSFLYGNYMTLSNLSPAERDRIVEQRLSPLYISVHSTDRAVRNRLLGNPKAPDIMKELRFFADRRIRMHTQIVLCPGYNDGEDLRRTIADLARLYPFVASIAVVPVGLTAHRSVTLAPVARGDAEKAIATVATFQKRFTKKYGDALVYCSDEMFIKAAQTFPPLKDYGTLPQIENGVGMVPLFLNQARRVKVSRTPARDIRFVTFTGTSFYPFLRKFADRLVEKENLPLRVMPVENRFFGTSVSVAGLLTGRDVIKTLQDETQPGEVLLVPDVSLREEEDVFLDDVTLGDIHEATGVRAVRMEATPQGLVDAIAAESSGKRS